MDLNKMDPKDFLSASLHSRKHFSKKDCSCKKSCYHRSSKSAEKIININSIQRSTSHKTRVMKTKKKIVVPSAKNSLGHLITTENNMAGFQEKRKTRS